MAPKSGRRGLGMRGRSILGVDRPSRASASRTASARNVRDERQTGAFTVPARSFLCANIRREMGHTIKARELEHKLAAVRGQPLVILVSGHPDPDAMGSALAHQRICERFGVPATIAHVHPISRAENRALVKLLNIQMLHITDPRELERFEHLSLVDASTPDPTIELPEDLKLLSVVDHHRSPMEVEAPFVDVRPELGATASIYTEYVETLAPFTQDARDDMRAATTLLFGIQTDTDDYTLATSTDFRAAAYLKPYCDTAVLGRVGHRTLPAESMDVLGRALRDLEVIRDFAFVGVGIVTPAQRDAIPTAADFILRRDDIDTVLVYGLVGDRVDGSLRTNSPSIDPSVFLDTALGTDSRGRPYGGGRADKGGFQIPLGIMADVDDEDALWEMVKQMVRRRFARVVPGLERSAHGGV